MSPKITQPLIAQDIIIYLANGCDPDTGMKLAEDSPLHRPNVIRALFLASDALSWMSERITDSAKAEKSSYHDPSKVDTSELSEVQKDVLKEVVDHLKKPFVSKRELLNQNRFSKAQDRVSSEEDKDASAPLQTTANANMLNNALADILAEMKETGVITLPDDLVSKILNLTWEKKEASPSKKWVTTAEPKKWHSGFDPSDDKDFGDVTMPKPRNAGSPWLPEQDDFLRDDFEAGRTLASIAEAHGRSLGAIKSRLVKLGLVVSWD